MTVAVAEAERDSAMTEAKEKIVRENMGLSATDGGGQTTHFLK